MRYLIGIDNGSQSTKVSVSNKRRPRRVRGAPDTAAEQHAASRHRRAPRRRHLVLDRRGEPPRHGSVPGSVADIVGVGLCTIRVCRGVAPLRRRLGQSGHELNRAAQVSRSLSARQPRRCLRSHLVQVHKPPDDRGEQGHRCQLRGRVAVAGEPAGNGCVTTRASRKFQVQPRNALRVAACLGTSWPRREDPNHTSCRRGRQGLPVVATSNDKAVEALGAGCARPTPCSCRWAPTPAHVPDAKSFW